MSTPPVETPAGGKYRLLVHAAVVVALLVLTVLRAREPAMNRPFEPDEILTVFFYTWVGLQEDGEAAKLDHIDEYYALPPPSIRHQFMGIYCAAGRWPEPNNHILNSLLVNTSVAVQRSEWAARLPALVGAAVFAAAMYWLCGPVLGWRFAAPLAALWAWFCPYMAEFGLRSRGYTWMLALQVLFLLAARWLAGRPGSLLRGAVCAGIAVATFLNVINMAVDWLLPAYLALLFFPPARNKDNPVRPGGTDGQDCPSYEQQGEARTAWRRNLLAQMIAVGAVGLMFLISHLPNIYSSAQQYGLAIGSIGDFFDLLVRAIDFLFPGIAWKVFGALSVFGLILLATTGHDRWLLAVIGLTLAISIVHFLLARRLPFERGLAYILPFAMLGTAYLVECGVTRMESLAGGALVWAACAGLSIPLALPAFQVNPSDERQIFSQKLVQQEQPNISTELPTLLLLQYGFDYILYMYRPREWKCVERTVPGQELQILLCVRYQPATAYDMAVRGGTGPIPVWRTFDWEYRHFRPIEPFDLVQLIGETRAFPDPSGPHPRAMVFWYPDPTRLGVNAKEQFRYADQSGLNYLPRYTRYQAKLDIFSNLESLVLLPETEEQYVKATEVVRKGIERFGGHAVVFVPRKAPRQK